VQFEGNDVKRTMITKHGTITSHEEHRDPRRNFGWRCYVNSHAAVGVTLHRPSPPVLQELVSQPPAAAACCSSMSTTTSLISKNINNFDLNFDTEDKEDQDTSTGLFKYCKSVCKIG